MKPCFQRLAAYAYKLQPGGTNDRSLVTGFVKILEECLDTRPETMEELHMVNRAAAFLMIELTIHAGSVSAVVNCVLPEVSNQ